MLATAYTKNVSCAPLPSNTKASRSPAMTGLALAPHNSATFGEVSNIHPKMFRMPDRHTERSLLHFCAHLWEDQEEGLLPIVVAESAIEVRKNALNSRQPGENVAPRKMHVSLTNRALRARHSKKHRASGPVLLRTSCTGRPAQAVRVPCPVQSCVDSSET